MTSQPAVHPADQSDTQTNDATSRTNASSGTSQRSIFAIPPAIKRVFDQFPLRAYEADVRPARSPGRRQDAHALYVFATKDGASAGAPSFNPGCLKWQTYLNFKKIPFRLIASNNHASPTGALPFLIPSTRSSRGDVVASHKLQDWCLDSSKTGDRSISSVSAREEAFLSLVDRPIRRAWLHSLYLTSNLNKLAAPVYIHANTSSSLVRTSMTRDLHFAALKEVRDSSLHSTIQSHSQSTRALGLSEVEDLYMEAEKALEALAILLGEDRWFGGQQEPGILDAAVFAYTHLLMLEASSEPQQTEAQGDVDCWEWRWHDTRLRELVTERRSNKNLRSHRDRILQLYYPLGVSI